MERESIKRPLLSDLQALEHTLREEKIHRALIQVKPSFAL